MTGEATGSEETLIGTRAQPTEASAASPQIEISTILTGEMEGRFDASSKEGFRGFLKYLSEDVTPEDLLADRTAQAYLKEGLSAGRGFNPNPGEERQRKGYWNDTRFVSATSLAGDESHLYYFADDPTQVELRRISIDGGPIETVGAYDRDKGEITWREIPNLSSSDVTNGRVGKTISAPYSSNQPREGRMSLAQKIIDRDTPSKPNTLGTIRRGLAGLLGRDSK